jgi:hypothetical protein
VGLFLVYPFAAMLRAIPSAPLKNLFSMLGGLFLVQWIFGADWIHSFVSSAVTYVLCAILPKRQVATVVFIWVMGYMLLSHVYRMYVSYLSGIFDFTGTQMVLTMKLTSFAYNLYDGTADKARVFPDKPHADKKDAKLYAERQRFAITRLPNPLEFFGYVYCFTCILAGPAFEYNDYIKSIDGSIFARNADKDKQSNGKGKEEKPPSSLLNALFTLLLGVVCLVGHLVLSGHYPLSRIYDAAFIAAHNHVERYGYTWVALAAERLKYYFAWKVAEGASILGGFGFEGYDANGKPLGWSAVENISIVGFETAPNTQILSRSWNKRTQGWLERYTYLRTGKSLLMTYFVSAIWHGVYPGFFLFFMTIPILTEIERLTRVKINPLVVPSYDGYNISTYPKTFVGYAYWFFNWVCTTISMNYIVQVFPIQSWGRCHAALGSYYYAPHALLFVVFLALKSLPTPKGSKKAA